jgi:hypothetical protein
MSLIGGRQSFLLTASYPPALALPLDSPLQAVNIAAAHRKIASETARTT